MSLFCPLPFYLRPLSHLSQEGFVDEQAHHSSTRTLSDLKRTEVK